MEILKKIVLSHIFSIRIRIRFRKCMGIRIRSWRTLPPIGIFITMGSYTAISQSVLKISGMTAATVHEVKLTN